jgi:translation initiation factor 3 subunit C
MDFCVGVIRLIHFRATASLNPSYCPKDSRLHTHHTEYHSPSMASRFFHGADSDESSSSDEEELYSEQEGEESQDEEEDEDEDEDLDDDDSSSDEEGKGGASRFLRAGASDSEDSEDEEREKVVKSAKDKRLEELEGTIKLIENAEKINDWAVISTGKLIS